MAESPPGDEKEPLQNSGHHLKPRGAPTDPIARPDDADPPASSPTPNPKTSVLHPAHPWTTALGQLRESVREALANHSCYDLIPLSGKIVIFDERLPIKHAFFALVQNDIKCAPVWSSSTRKFVGLMTVTDFADILVESHDKDAATFRQKCLDLENQTVIHWSMYKKRRGHAPRNSLVCINPNEPIEHAVQTLYKLFIHRLPVLNDKDGTSIICIINHHKIIRFLMGKLIEKAASSLPKGSPAKMDATPAPRPPPRGLFDAVPLRALDHRIVRVSKTCKKSDPIVEVLRGLTDKSRLPGIPITDDSGEEIWDCFARSDIRYLAMERQYLKLHVSVEQFLTSNHVQKSRNVPRVSLDDSLRSVLTTLIANRRHLCVVMRPAKGGKKKQTFHGIFTLGGLFGDWVDPTGTKFPRTASPMPHRNSTRSTGSGFIQPNSPSPGADLPPAAKDPTKPPLASRSTGAQQGQPQQRPASSGGKGRSVFVEHHGSVPRTNSL